MSDDGFYALGISCRHCGGQLEAKAIIQNGGISIKGLRSLEYRHAATRLPTCTITYDARPYDGWTASATFEAARKVLSEPGQ